MAVEHTCFVWLSKTERGQKCKEMDRFIQYKINIAWRKKQRRKAQCSGAHTLCLSVENWKRAEIRLLSTLFFLAWLVEMLKRWKKKYNWRQREIQQTIITCGKRSHWRSTAALFDCTDRCEIISLCIVQPNLLYIPVHSCSNYQLQLHLPPDIFCCVELCVHLILLNIFSFSPTCALM